MAVAHTMDTIDPSDALDVQPPRSRPPRTLPRGRFSRGSVIELGGGRRKRVEQLCVEDFAHSAAALKVGTHLEPISVAHILQRHDSNSVVVGFRIAAHQTQVLRMKYLLAIGFAVFLYSIRIPLKVSSYVSRGEPRGECLCPLINASRAYIIGLYYDYRLSFAR